MQYVRDHGLPAVAMCVSTTYGAGDWGRTPHGAIIAGAAFGKLPFVMKGIELEAVGIDDAARAMILAAEHGKVGRAIPDLREDDQQRRRRAHRRRRRGRARAREVRAARHVLDDGGARQRQGPAARAPTSSCRWARLRLMRAEAPVDCSKAKRELGWQPRPVEESIREAAKFWVGLRDAKRKSKRAG